MRRLCVATALLFAVSSASAQDRPTGFTRASAAMQLELERLLQQAPTAAASKAHARVLAAEPHVAGTAAQGRTADYVLRRMAEWGLDTVRSTFRVYLPHPESTIVALVKPRARRLSLNEPMLAEDPSTRSIFPAMNGYSGAGDVTAELVYVNYGLPDDFRVLDSIGVSVRGKVAIARYGRSFRGIKAREAEKAGAIGLLMYSDPADDGYVRGDTYPTGAWRHPDAPQRGSIFNGNGDPSTPGWAATESARHLSLDQMQVSRIPVVPIGYRNAQLLLQGLKGDDIPAQAWQGGLPFRYHLGGDAGTRVRVAVYPEQGEKAYKTIVNTIGILRGSVLPDEWVITGGHRDAWGPGALDNVSGVVTILESAAAWSAAAKAGFRPRRSLLFATWDAEEWGLVGSTEWTELMADSLRANAVAYLNQDVTASGRSFGASGTGSLQPFVRETVRSLVAPGDTATVYASWRRTSAVPHAEEPPMGDLGGGSDFAGFYNGLGIASFDFGFGGAGGGSYHSAYDTYTNVERFADPGYLSHAAAARVNAVLLARLANAELLPFDFGYFGRYLQRYVERMRGKTAGVDLAPVEQQLAALATAGDSLARARDAALASGANAAAMTAANAELRRVEQALTRPEGIRGRPWMRNLTFAADRDNGYANVALPGLAEAARDNDGALAAREVTDLAARLAEATRRVHSAIGALGH